MWVTSLTLALELHYDATKLDGIGWILSLISRFRLLQFKVIIAKGLDSALGLDIACSRKTEGQKLFFEIDYNKK